MIPDEITKLNSELSDALTNFHAYHGKIDTMRDYYLNSVFYQTKSGDPLGARELKVNYLRVFADKNIHYTSQFPKIKVPANPDDRENASIREKILYATHTKSNTPLLRRRWARDATVLSAAISEVETDYKNRCVYVRRYDPRNCVWQISNDNDRRVLAFWALYPITLDECEQRYGVVPDNNGGLPENVRVKSVLKGLDGKTWFLQATKWTATQRMTWVGNKWIEQPHNHGQDGIPIDICLPFDDSNENNQGSFYLEPLLSLQAELNYVAFRKSKIVSRMSSPVLWGKNIVNRGFDDMREKMKNPGGGMVGLGRNGEVGLLEVQDPKLLDTYRGELINDMQRIAGFSSAAFGESVGANTSGDALGMYFTPTQRMIDDQYVAWTAFDQAINAKILRAWYNLLTYGDEVSMTGFAPSGTLESVKDRPGEYAYRSGQFQVTFDKEKIGKNYDNVVIQKAITPKDDNAERKWALEAVNQGVLSRHTAYEYFGILSPEDELELLKIENSEPLLNPEGTSKLLSDGATAPSSTLPPSERIGG